MKPHLPLVLISLLCLSWSQPITAVAMPKDLHSADVLNNRTDYLIARGRVGEISKTTNRQQLSSIFKSAQLMDFVDRGPEGDGEIPATRVLSGEQIILDVLWKDESRQQATSVHIYDRRWHTAAGVAVGMPVSKMQKLFGKFDFYGFRWDYGGVLLEGNSKLDRYRKNLGVDFLMGMPVGKCQSRPRDCDAVTGEKRISSSHKALDRLQVKVVRIVVAL
jgi:hypothetical protein